MARLRIRAAALLLLCAAAWTAAQTDTDPELVTAVLPLPPPPPPLPPPLPAPPCSDGAGEHACGHGGDDAWLQQQQTLGRIIVVVLSVSGGVLAAAALRFARCCHVQHSDEVLPETQLPQEQAGTLLRRIRSWRVAPAVLTELPDGSMVAAVPQSKSGLARGRSYWGSGGFGFGRRSSSGGSSSWAEALANLRAHWPGEAGGAEDAAVRARGGAPGPSFVP